jgi:dTDP-4-dehydrorhamnose reductase
MRCLVTGAKGLLGTELVRYLRQENNEVVGWDLPEHDVADVEKTINDMHRVGPNVVFHLAAWTDVDGCEKEPARAASINFQGTWAVALGTAELRCRMVYVSTDYVFDGKAKRPYDETDKPNPISVYGRSKLMGEKAVMRSCAKFAIVRTSGLYGPHGRNFVDTIRKLCREKDRVEVVTDQTSSPTYAPDLCEPLLEIAGLDKSGVYHVTNSGACSWYELALRVKELTGVGCEIVPITAEKLGRPAPRPAFSVLDNRNYKRKFGKELRPWQEALAEYLGGK